jgi:hypothetical protein
MKLIIKNIKTKDEIEIEGDLKEAPKLYDDVPKLNFQLDEIDWLRHLNSCNTCKNFLLSFGTDTNDWLIECYGILDLSKFSNSYNNNTIQYIINDYFTGTLVKFTFKTLIPCK